MLFVHSSIFPIHLCWYHFCLNQHFLLSWYHISWYMLFIALNLQTPYRFLECRLSTCRSGIHGAFQSKRIVLTMWIPFSIEDIYHPHTIVAISLFSNAVTLWNLFCAGALSIRRTPGCLGSATAYRCLRRRRINKHIAR